MVMFEIVLNEFFKIVLKMHQKTSNYSQHDNESVNEVLEKIQNTRVTT